MSAVGLCEHCRHAQIIQSKRGSTFYLCLRSDEDASFAKYPRLPVSACRGYEAVEDFAANFQKRERGFGGRVGD